MRAPSFKIKFLLLSLAWVGWLVAMGVLPIAVANQAPPAGGAAQPSNQAPPAGGAAQPGNQAPPTGGTPRPATPVMQPVRLTNPLSGINSIPDLLAAVLNVFIVIAIPIIIFFIMLAGFKYVTARGNSDQISEASKALLYAIIGAVLVIGSTAIAQILKNLVNAFRS